MESFGERLKRLMRETGLTEANMAMLLNVSMQRVENLVTGYCDADIDTLSRVAQIFNVSCAYAAARSDDPEVKEPNFAKEIYVTDKLRAGDGMVTQKNVIGTVYMERSEMHGKDYFGLIMQDDSMVKARMFKNDTLIVRRQNTANNGDIVVAMVDDGEAIVRRYNRTGNTVVLTAEGDTMKYKTLKINTEYTKLLVLGKVCEVRINLI